MFRESKLAISADPDASDLDEVFCLILAFSGALLMLGD
jgi:hypothetical protein